MIDLAIVIFHTLRMRRQERVVSSLYLWRLATRALAADHRRHRLIRSLLLLTQLLIVSLLAFALAEPIFPAASRPARLGLVVDTSASMAAGPDVPRISAAVQAVESFLSAGDAGRYLLWSTTGAHKRYAGSSKEELLDALRRLPPPGGTSDWDALKGEIAAELDDEAPALLVLVTDGAVDPEAVEWLTSLRDEVRLYLIDVGRALDNVAITGMSARPSGREPGHHQVLVEVANFGSALVRTRLGVTSTRPGQGEAPGAQEIVFSAAVELGPREREQFLFDHTFRPGEILSAAIEVSDALAVDDAAYLASAGDEPIRVLLIGERNHFLVEGFSSFDLVELAHSFDPRAAVELRGSYDLAVFYGELPPPDFLGTALVFPGAGEDGGASAEIVWWDRRHPLSRFVDWEGVSLGRVAPIRPAPEEHTLVDSTAGPVVTVADEGGLRVVRVGIPLAESDFPFRVAFPVFLQNVLEWVRPAGRESVPPAVPPGRLPDSLAVLARAGEPVTVFTPRGDTVSIGADAGLGDAAYAALLVPGVYTWRAGERSGRFSLSLLDGSESDLSGRLAGPLAALGAGIIDPSRDRLAELVSALESASAPSPYPPERLWRWIALSVLVLLLVEGHLYVARRLGGAGDSSPIRSRLSRSFRRRAGVAQGGAKG